MSRIRNAIVASNERAEKAMGLFLTSGFPDPNSTLPILQEIDRSGADFIELGMPFSDPLAEGHPVQRSSERALRQGVRLEDTLRTARAFRTTSDTPLLLMGYINPIYRYGVHRFCREAVDAGVDGLILPDLPPEEAGLIRDEADGAGLPMIYLIAPNTSDERIIYIDGLSRGFVYAVSVTGLTGSGLGTVDRIAEYLARARTLVERNPLLVGFGIKSNADWLPFAEHTDGFIVGSALIELVERLWGDHDLTADERFERLGRFVRALRYGGVVEQS